MPERNSFHTGLPILDMVFNAYTQMFDVQRNMLTAGFSASPFNALSGAAGMAGNKPFGAYREEMRGEAEVGIEEQRVIPLVREELRVGKRQVESSKRYRIATHVVEVPVEQEVMLYDEQVHIERRPAAGMARQDGGPTFHSETVEVRELHEQPVVTKVIVENEEVVIYKTRTERRQKIRGTVRETRYDVHAENGTQRIESRQSTDVEGHRPNQVTELRAAAGNKPEGKAVVEVKNEQHGQKHDKDDDEARRRRHNNEH